MTMKTQCLFEEEKMNREQAEDFSTVKTSF